jgi:hypothetical protein
MRGQGSNLLCSRAAANRREGYESPPLQRKIHAAQKVLKARVGAEGIEGRINL